MHVEKLHDEIMVVHDEVMPEMSTIHKLKRTVGRSDLNESLQDSLETMLETASEAMMEWMAQYDKPSSGDSLQLLYLEDQLVKIKQVSEQMKSSIQIAKSYAEK